MSTMVADIPVHAWQGCYDDSWRCLITDKAFAHPAKFAPGLIRRIFAHGIERGWWNKGDLVADPFGGIAGGGIMAGYCGLNWIGIELEDRFHKLGNANLAMHRPKWLALGEANCVKLIQGDSRRFAELVGQAAGVVTSPPYADSVDGRGDGIDWKKATEPTGGTRTAGRGAIADGYGAAPGQIGTLKSGDLSAVVTSPPFGIDQPCASQTRAKKDYHAFTRGDGTKRDHAMQSEGNIAALPVEGLAAVVTSPPYNKPFSQDHNGSKGGKRSTGETDTSEAGSFAVYGKSGGQIEGLPNGSVDAVVTSPPYAECVNGEHGETETAAQTVAARRTRGGSLGQSCRHGGYGVSGGQIGALKEGKVAAVVTSPPYSGTHVAGDMRVDNSKRGTGTDLCMQQGANYGETDGNIGHEQGETYWTAMSQVYRQCLIAIRPGGYMAVVVKDYVKDKARVPLCDQTLQLLMHIGFEPVERIHAMLVRETRHNNLFGGETIKRKERKSFFRRLAESKGSPRIDHEEVLVVRKPGEGGKP
jgi:DNA modification methylase